MRKRTQSTEQPDKPSAEARTQNMFEGYQPPAKSPEPEWQRFPLEENIAGMVMAIGDRGYGVPLTAVAAWSPHQRHVVAMWLAGKSGGGTDDLPELVRPYIDPTLPYWEKQREASDAAMASKVVVAPEAIVTPVSMGAEQLLEAVAADTAKVFEAPEAKSRVVKLADRRPDSKPFDVHVAIADADELREGETVTATWGAEKYTPVANSYSTFEVGPFTATVAVRPGETRSSALRRAYAELEEVASEIRERKKTEFIAALKGMRREVQS